MAQARLLPAYLVVGPDELKREEAVARLRARVDGPFSAFNYEEVTATADLDPSALLGSLDTLPMGGDLRVVVLKGADRLPKPVSEAIVSYLGHPNPSCTLAVVAEALARTTRLYKALAKVGPRSVIDCAARRGRDLPPYVRKLAAAHGVCLAPDAVAELVFRVGDSTTLLDAQLASLAALLGGSGTVTRDLVERNVARVAEVKPWDLLDRLSARDAHRSLALLRLMDGSALGLLTLVTGRVRELVCARCLAARGQAQGIAAALGKRDWQVRNHARWAAGFGPGELERALVACAATERALKSGADADTQMTRLVTLICGVR